MHSLKVISFFKIHFYLEKNIFQQKATSGPEPLISNIIACKSLFQRPWHIGIHENGKSIRGSKAKKDKHASHFLPRPIEGIYRIL